MLPYLLITCYFRPLIQGVYLEIIIRLNTQYNYLRLEILFLRDRSHLSNPCPLLIALLSLAGREGLISRDEITAYFMRASSIYSKLGLGFPHNFQETTYLKPTFCDNCAGFVSS